MEQVDDLYAYVLRYFFWSYRLVIQGMDKKTAIQELRSRAVQGGGGFWGSEMSAEMDWHDHHIKAWLGRRDGPPAIDVTVDRAANDAYYLMYAPMRQERLL